MSLIKLYLDEDAMDLQLVQVLRARNVDVLTVLEAQTIGLSDLEQLTWASENKRVIYTFNVDDFCRLHASWLAEQRSHSGIIIAQQQRYSIGEQMKRILNLMAAQSQETMVDQLIYLNNYGNP